MKGIMKREDLGLIFARIQLISSGDEIFFVLLATGWNPSVD
jgi:hypothetical protein